MKKKITFSHDSKITVQVFNALSSNFPQMITNLTEDTELTFTERLERLCVIIILLIMLLSHVLNESNSNFAVEISYELMNVLSHFTNFISLQKFFPIQPLSFNCSIFKNKDFSRQCNGFFFLKVAKNWLRLIFHYFEYLTLLMFCVLFLTFELLFTNSIRNMNHENLILLAFIYSNIFYI